MDNSCGVLGSIADFQIHGFAFRLTLAVQPYTLLRERIFFGLLHIQAAWLLGFAGMSVVAYLWQLTIVPRHIKNTSDLQGP